MDMIVEFMNLEDDELDSWIRSFKRNWIPDDLTIFDSKAIERFYLVNLEGKVWTDKNAGGMIE